MRKTSPGQKPRGLREELVREGRENPEARTIQKVMDVTINRKVHSSMSNSTEIWSQVTGDLGSEDEWKLRVAQKGS